LLESSGSVVDAPEDMSARVHQRLRRGLHLSVTGSIAQAPRASR
jgi:hypothetical protein